MRKLAFCGAFLLVCSGPVFAQAPDATSRPAQTPDSNSQSNETTRPGDPNAKKVTMTGCISQHNGKYILMTSNPPASPSAGTQSNEPSNSQSSQSSTQPSEQQGTQRAREVELISSQDLKPHVGHTVQVTGTMENTSAMGGDKNNTSSSSEPSADSTKNSQSSTMNDAGKKNRPTMRVTDMQMISETCDMKSGTTSPQ